MVNFEVPRSRVEQVLTSMGTGTGGRLICAFGANDLSEYGLFEFLYHEPVGSWKRGTPCELPAGLHPVLIGLAGRLNDYRAAQFVRELGLSLAEAGLLLVTVGRDLRVYYALPASFRARPPVVLSMPGPAMEQLVALPLADEGDDAGRHAGDEQKGRALPERRHRTEDGPGAWREKFSRLAGLLGEGDLEEGYRLLAKARRLRVVLVGAGGAGSWLALTLCQMGVGAEGGFCIADPDTVELSNLSRLIVPGRTVGMPKVEAVAGTARAMGLETVPFPICASVNSPEVVDAIRASQVVMTAVDEGAARFGAGVLARRYLLLHMDVSGGAAWTAQRKAIIGGELRVSVPGCVGCACCMGRYRPAEVEKILAESEGARRSGVDWQKQRPGSDVSVLMPVLGEAVQALMNVLRGRITSSLWLHYEKTPDGLPDWQNWSKLRKWRRCPFCKQAGLGDLPR